MVCVVFHTSWFYKLRIVVALVGETQTMVATLVDFDFAVDVMAVGTFFLCLGSARFWLPLLSL